MLPERPCQALLYMEGGEALLRIISPAEAEAYEHLRRGSGLDSGSEDAAHFMETVIFQSYEGGTGLG